MEKDTLKLEVISIVIMLLILTCMSGCYSTRTISKTDIPLPESSRYSDYPYMVHFRVNSFMLEEPKVSDGILSGTLTQINKTSYPEQIINIYLLSDSVAHIDENGVLSVPVDAIKEIKAEGPDATKTTLLATYGVVAVVTGVLIGCALIYGLYALFTIPAL